MELYGKKFFVYGNCMIRSFGQPRTFAPKVNRRRLEVPDQRGDGATKKQSFATLFLGGGEGVGFQTKAVMA